MRVLDKISEWEIYVDSQPVAVSECMQSILSKVRQLAPIKLNVLLTGPTGSGKSYIAPYFHYWSRRSSQPFVPVDCGTLTESLLEAELYGCVKGAFTGADADRRGLFEAAHGGTIFLDEIGNLTLAAQSRFLQALEKGYVRPVGSAETYKVDVRVVAATNVDIEYALRERLIREDLYYRLSTEVIDLPPLNDHREDIPALVQSMLASLSRELGLESDGVDLSALLLLIGHNWKGNIRELHKVVTQLLLRCEGRLIEGPLVEKVLMSAEHRTRLLSTRMEDIEEQMLREVLCNTPNDYEAASQLGLSQNTLDSKKRRFGISSRALRRERPRI